jgi:hypothetical protein
LQRIGSMAVRVVGAGCALLLGCALVLGQPLSTTTKKTTHKSTSHKSTSGTSSTHSTKGKRSKKTATNWRKRGQQKIDPQRAKEIQDALIREHYLNGQASGTWDDASQKAMEKFQADNGWQSKTVPDSRALIKLGLGPDHQHLLNPESAMTTAPASGPVQSKDDPGSTPPQN